MRTMRRMMLKKLICIFISSSPSFVTQLSRQRPSMGICPLIYTSRFSMKLWDMTSIEASKSSLTSSAETICPGIMRTMLGEAISCSSRLIRPWMLPALHSMRTKKSSL